MAIDFPSSPANNDVYTDPTSGNKYTWNNVYSYWAFTGGSAIGSSSNTYVLFNDSDEVNGTSGFTFDKSTNTVTIGTATVNTTNYSGTANNASFLGGVAAASYVNTSGEYTITGVHTHNANIVIGTSAGFIANGVMGTNSQILTSNGTTVYWADAPSSGGGFYKGNNGAVGNTNNINNIFRINANTITSNITFVAGENAVAAGPITVNTSVTLTVETGARVVIV